MSINGLDTSETAIVNVVQSNPHVGVTNRILISSVDTSKQCVPMPPREASMHDSDPQTGAPTAGFVSEV